jgi:acyl carrier protein
VEKELVELLQDMLDIYPIGVEDKYGELGGDSFNAVRFIDRINSTLNCELRTVDLYDGVTIKDVARLIQDARAPMDSDSVSPDDDERKAATDVSEIRNRFLKKRQALHSRPADI